MKLSDIRDWHRRQQKNDDAISGNVSLHGRMADAIDAHLTQPAQAADVGAIREVIAWLRRQEGIRVDPDHVAESLTAALPNAKGKEG